MLELNHVSYTMDDRPIIKNLSLTVNKGEAISITGPSGSGKSTLLRLIGDLISPTEGTLTFDNQAYENYTPEELRLRVSYLSQSIELFGDTVSDNLRFPSIVRNDDFDEERAQVLMKAVGLEHYQLSDSVHRMSGGEKQRVTIARQLMYQPDILLLDEATSALDHQNSMRVEKLIFDLVAQGMTVMWITHDDEQSHRSFDRQLIIKDGVLEKEVHLT
ncbi:MULTISPECIES: ATP-binding cassette domain-containing protein [unclassified Staphylococcus]|uniref:ABC transporter ATP-binding protein n=1 Tax=unclassified Staphylococcus TaxID=91994 RepID=UPI0021CEBE6C|nr:MULTISPECIES: ATP-binding cassette domain-containing protein [unclassified Staphylococcus]UXR70152.1 ATP-binding cassette domain-containing protein [Staphylococcus sp. IVB6246]UXR72211.1 ATP-binding cassette domain-containing protein [Staphylococcus sp. IVB6240]UXR74520.1 ATP-binding cassette domain-containing protein [Staphylococcus sp. IVB6238]UXR76904.1 ATP-binding cassette domain-containing protein [Staphylococcus sp. IVB6233]UXR81030.1 ATP-binding cassette domain-containing protein [St